MHGLLHVQSDLRSVQRAIRVPDLVQELDTVQACLIRNLLVWLARSQGLLDVVSAGAAEDDDVQKRVSAETVRTVDGYASSLASSIQAGNNLVVAALLGKVSKYVYNPLSRFTNRVSCDDRASVLGGDTTHCRQQLEICPT